MSRKIEAPEGVTGSVREIYELVYDNRNFSLSKYSYEDLVEAKQLLNSHGIKVKLQRSITEELNIRDRKKDETKPVKNDVSKWFSPLWWAVMSLFDKGHYIRENPHTKELLDAIDPDWIYNCKGMK